jgi:hypothetical protein
MLALFLDHPPMFVAGEIALGLSLALFFGALVVAIADRASEAQLRKAAHSDPTIVRRPAGEPVPARSNVDRQAFVTRPMLRSGPRYALSQLGDTRW